jgi:hypothetical protein
MPKVASRKNLHCWCCCENEDDEARIKNMAWIDESWELGVKWTNNKPQHSPGRATRGSKSRKTAAKH